MAASNANESYTPITNHYSSKDVAVCVGLVVDKVLDADILSQAAHTLIKQWPILGGTIVTSTKPWSFIKGEKVDVKSRTVEKVREDFFDLKFSRDDADSPEYIDQPGGGQVYDECFFFDALHASRPGSDALLMVRITVLHDATLLGFRAPHYLVNSTSLYDIVAAYSRSISGETLPQLKWPPDADGTPLSSLVMDIAQPKLPGGVKLDESSIMSVADTYASGMYNALPVIYNLLRSNILARFFSSYGLKENLIHIPLGLLEKWRADCQRDLENGAWKGEGAPPTLSKLDVLTAWLMQTTNSTVKPEPGPIELVYPTGYRTYLPLPPTDTCYIKNTTYELYLRWKFSDMQLSSLAIFAVSLRTKVLASKQASVVRESLQVLESNPSQIVVQNTANRQHRLDRNFIVTTWTEDFAGLDFSNAAVTKGERAKVDFVLPRNVFPGPKLLTKNLAFVVRDGKGGYWIRVTLDKVGWKAHGVEF